MANLGRGCEGVLGEVLIESAGKLNAATELAAKNAGRIGACGAPGG